MHKAPIRIVGAALNAERRSRRRLVGWACVCAVLVAAVFWTAVSPSAPRLLWNASASAPVGLWRVRPGAPVDRGDMVVVRLAQPWRALAARRHYLPANVPLLKRVAAMSGDRICAFESWIFIEGRTAAVRRRFDDSGRPMPWWHGCVTLADGALLLLMDDPASFDGRYFGPVERSAVVGRAVPLWLR
jgi:conjugative transfer signal peptidase TraF